MHDLEGLRCVLSKFGQLMQAGFFLVHMLSRAGDEWDKRGRSVHGFIPVCGTCIGGV